MAWTLGIAFVAGLLNPAFGVIVTAISTFVLAFAFRRAPWRWAVLSLTAWATGAAVGMLLTRMDGAYDFAGLSQASAGVTVLTAYLSAYAGAWLNWVASRVVREQ
jgi:hypothetical protein